MNQLVSRLARLSVLSACLLAAQCTGTETTNPLRAFGSGECKTGHEDEYSLTPANALTTRDPYAGLDCLVYQVRDDVLQVQLRNLRDGCHVEHEGHVRRPDQGRLQLALSNAKCATAACGSCVYDAEFEVDLAPFEGEDALELSVVLDDSDSCRSRDSEPQEYWKLEISLRESSRGATCNYARYFDPPRGCGTINMPCAGDDGACEPLWGAAGTTCEDGLTCQTPGEHPTPVCMQPCTTDADCPEPSVLHCVDGLCRL